MLDIDLLMSGVESCLTRERLEKKLKEKRRLTVKLGFDPTAPDLHLGHSVVLNKLAQFQKLGHDIVVVVGGFTAMIGDPTGRNKLRPVLSREDIKCNALTYIDQLSCVLDVNSIRVVNNVDWFSRIDFAHLMRILSSFTLSQIVQRNDFADRMEHNRPLYMHELIYPIMQAYDSHVIKADVEIGGSDQLFNCLIGSDLQRMLGEEEQVVLCMPLLVGLDGKEKMSKSKGNYIGLTETPFDMYGKVMSIPDSLLYDYVTLVSSFDENEKDEILDELKNDASCDFMGIKKRLAYDIVKRYHSSQDAENAQIRFRRIVQDKNISDEDFEGVTVTLENSDSSQKQFSLLDLCHCIYKGSQSRSALKRLIISGSVKLDNVKLLDPYCKIDTSHEVRLVFSKRKAFIVNFVCETVEN